MTMTKELIDRLRTNANWLDEEDNDERAIRKSMLEAADTIQFLSEKLNALQTEPCEDCISREAALAGLANIAKAKAKSGAQKAMMGRSMFFIERLPSVQPEPFINKPCISEGVCREDKMKVLEKIRAEILEEKECAYADFERYKVDYLGQDWEDAYDSLPQDDFRYGMERCIEIIDKYMAERSKADASSD